MSTQEQLEKQPELTPLLSFLAEWLQMHQPANDYANASHKLTTLELLEQMQQHYPFMDLTAEALYNFLLLNKFKYSAIGEKYVWLINK